MIIIWGYGLLGISLYREFRKNIDVDEIHFADNNPFIHDRYVNYKKVFSLESLIAYRKSFPETNIEIYIASLSWRVIANELEENGFTVKGYYLDGKLNDYGLIGWKKINGRNIVKLYAGDICDETHYSDKNLFGLSITKEDDRHIFHDITKTYPIQDNCIDAYQAEDVLEHIQYEMVVDVINEIWRVLKPGAVFRVCLPDYNSPYLKSITLSDESGNSLFDPTGGGKFISDLVVGGGHVWFPTIENVKKLLDDSYFDNIRYLCYRENDGRLKKSVFDYNNGFVNRIETCQKDSEIYSIVIDCEK